MSDFDGIFKCMTLRSPLNCLFGVVIEESAELDENVLLREPALKILVTLLIEGCSRKSNSFRLSQLGERLSCQTFTAEKPHDSKHPECV